MQLPYAPDADQHLPLEGALVNGISFLVFWRNAIWMQLEVERAVVLCRRCLRCRSSDEIGVGRAVYRRCIGQVAVI